MKFEPANLQNLCFERDAKRMRISSYDKTGGNDDRLTIQPGETVTFADIPGAGLITHIWVTMSVNNPPFSPGEQYIYRKVKVSFFWDGEENPSVLAPIGDFFGMGHGIAKNFVSEPLQMSPENGNSLNCWFPMPFKNGAKLCVTNECTNPIVFYFYVDYEEYDDIPDNALRFHAQWNREITVGKTPEELGSVINWFLGGTNTDGDGNYVILDAEGKGHYVGCNINIHNLSPFDLIDWPGEGDDMIFIDDEPWPPRLHGTGTEDYVNTAWSPQQDISAPYHGVILGGEYNWKGKISYYRYHVRDPIMFNKSIKVTIEHGHANQRSDDWSSTAYWYQSEPHKPQMDLPPVKARLPLDATGFGVPGPPKEPPNIQ